MPQRSEPRGPRFGNHSSSIANSSAKPCAAPVTSAKALSDFLWQHERFAICPPQQLVRLGVVGNGLGVGLEAQAAARAIGDIAEMTEPGTLVSFLDVGVRLLAGGDAVQEVAQMRLLQLRFLRRRLDAVLDV